MSDRTSGAEPIGEWRGVRIDALPADAVSVEAELAIVGMFVREVAAARPQGGLGHLDAALGGALVRLRADGIFGAAAGETLTLSATLPPIRAATIVAVGLGDPDAFSPAVLRAAVTAAAREALRHQVASAAFAPSLLDSGIDPARIADAEQAMLRGLVDALAPATLRGKALSRWIFCTGAAHLQATAAGFRAAFARMDRG